MKGKDSLILIRHNGATVAGAFDTDNYKHNTLAQMALVELELGHQVIFSRNVDRDKYCYNIDDTICHARLIDFIFIFAGVDRNIIWRS